MSTKTFTFEGDGYKFEVVLTLDGDGNVTATVTAVEGSADFNAFFWSDGDDTADFGGFTKKDSSLNMNGEGSQYEGEDVLWDGAEKITNPGLGKDGEEKSSFIKEGESETFDLTKMSKEDFDNLEYFGIRATSVNGDDSLKLVGTPEDETPVVPDDDWFPDFKDEYDRDISNVVVYFNIGEGDDCEVYTVKIDNWDEVSESNDLDDSWEAILAYIIANDEIITEDTPVLGAAIKGGQEEYFFGVGEFDTSGDTDPDDLPCDLEETITDSDIDNTFDADHVFAAA